MHQLIADQLPDHLSLTRCRHGLMLYLKQDRYIGRSFTTYGEFSEGEQHLFRAILRPGDRVIEAGANIGAHTIPLAKIVGPTGSIIAFEPQRIIFQLLCANVALNGLTNVQALPVALGAVPGEMGVPYVDYLKENNFGGLSLCDPIGPGIDTVRVETLDTFALDFNMLKIDVEGMESAVLTGAAHSIARLRPVLYLENGVKAKSQALIRQLFDAGYRVWRHRPLMFTSNNFFNHRENIFSITASYNMLALPQEMPVEIDLTEIITDQTNDKDWLAGT